jgi:HEAT repeat protein
VALGSAWSEHQFKDGLRNVGRSLRTDTSAAVRAQAATTIAGFKPDAVREIENELIKALEAEKDLRVRKELAVAIGRFPEVANKAVEQLGGALKDADPATRVAAADALAKAGADAKAAAPELLRVIDDSDRAARLAAIFALGRVAPDNPSFVAAALIKRFGEEKEAELRRELLVSLKLLGEKSESVVTALVAAIADPDDETRSVAIRTLGTFGADARPAADALLKVATGTADKNTRVDALRAFGSALGPALKDRVKDLIRVLETDPDFEVRVVAVEEIGALGNDLKDDKETITALRKRLSDPQVKVRESAAAAIRRIERKADKPPEKKP